MTISKRRNCTMLGFISLISMCFLMSVFVVSGCSSAPTNTSGNSSLSSMEWLIGNWENVSPKRTLCEQWEKLDDSTFAGKSFIVRNSDTTYLESIRLQKRDGVISYNPTVPDQNEGKAVQFILTVIDKSNFTFVNPQHDFPKKITYMLNDDGSLHSHLEGVENGTDRVQDFYMNRAK